MSDLSAEEVEKMVQRYNAKIEEAILELPETLREIPALRPVLVKVESVRANDYNPNRVAPPEMKLLERSIEKDGMTMPVVVCFERGDDGKEYTVIDGFHRRTVVGTNPKIRNRHLGYLPVSLLNKPVEDRIASTVRHNMARGEHQIDLSAELVKTLTKHHWSDERIGEELGMDPDEVLRMKQFSGLADMVADEDYSKAWEWSWEAEDDNPNA